MVPQRKNKDLFGNSLEKERVQNFTHDKTVGKEEWLTPRWILDALGDFDLDPCAAKVRPWDCAKQNYTIFDNGLLKPWMGRVWLNPPYGNETAKWIQRMSSHKDGGIALIFARTETATFFPWIWDYAHGFLFIEGRIGFVDNRGISPGGSGAPSVLISYSDVDSDFLATAAATKKIRGKFLMNEQVKAI